MREFIKENLALLLAFCLPIGLIAVIAISTYLPSLFLTSNYNFVYAICTDGSNYYSYRCGGYLQKRYSVEEGKLVRNVVAPEEVTDKDNISEVANYSTRLFVHNTETNESREVSFEQAEMLDLHELLTSPDGVTVSSDYDRGGDFFFIFDGSSSYGYYLTKGSARSKLNLINQNDRYYYRDNFRFMGWILPGR